MGSPHLHVLAAVLGELRTVASVDQELLTAMEKHCDGPGGMSRLHAAVPIFYVAKQHDESKAKIVFMDKDIIINTNDGPKNVRILTQVLSPYLLANGGELLEGAAPKNPAERRLAKFSSKKDAKKAGA